MNTSANFPAKSRVRYLGKMTNYKGVPYAGQLATVIRPLKTRNKVTIEWDMEGQPLFDAKPENLERVE